MKNILYTLIAIFFLSSCTKVQDTSTTNTDTTPTNTSTVAPNVKFFNVMDYGNVSVTFNTTSVGSLAIWYPTGYTAGIIGTNTITVTFGGTNVINESVDLLAGKSYSVFIYRVGYNWKISLVDDNLTQPAAGYSNVRVLDFRTQAYFDYVGVELYSPGNPPLIFSNRNFLDHESYSSYQNFNSIVASTYKITIFNDTANLQTKSNVVLASQGVYTVVLMTEAGLSEAQALENIEIDVEQNE